MVKSFIGLVIILLLAFPAFAQHTTVTAQVKDPTGALYQVCTGSANFTGQNTTPGSGPYTLNGSPFQTVVPIFCDGSANFTVSLSDNHVISPTPSQWTFNICSAIGAFPGPPICFTTLITITGATQNVTAELQAASAPLPSTGGSGTPGGTNGQVQYNSSSTAFGGVAGDLVATSFSGADVCAQITAAMASLPASGGTILVPGGNYPACAGSGGIAISITKPGVILRGMGSGSPMGPDVGATTINLAAGVTGIDMTGGKDHIQDLFLMSASSGAGTDDGIRVRGGDITLERVSVKHFGRYGVNVDGGNSGGSSDLWHFEDVESVSNYSDGFHWSTPCTDNHLGTGIQLNASLNGGWGYYIDCGSANRFITTHATQNALGGVYVGAPWNTWDNTYVESGVGSSFVVASGLGGVNANFQAFGQPTTITNPGATAAANRISYFGPDGWPMLNGINLGGQPGAASNKTYMFQVVGGQLGLFDYTDAQQVFTYDPASSTTRWLFGQKVTHTTTGTFAGLNIGGISGDPSTLLNGDMWYDLTANKFRCYENGAATNCIGAGGGSGTVTHTAGPLTLDKMVIGNGAADVTVDPNTTTDGAGNIVLTSIQTSGANGGLAGVEGNGSGLTPAIGEDLLYADSTSHCWHQSLNNVDSGCTLAAYTSGAGFGTVFGSPSVVRINQTSDTPWDLALTNSGNTNGLGIWVESTGIGSIQNLTNAGSVNAEIQLKPSGEVQVSGNGGANIEFRIPAGATPDFELINGSGGSITGSPRLKWYGVTSGNAVISVASVAGTPNPILLPTATGTANGLLTTNGANPQQTSWTLTPSITGLTTNGAGTGSIFGTTAVSSIVQTNNTPWALTFQNAVATSGGFGGLGIYVENTGDAFISENTTGGTVTGGFGLRQSGETYMVGNGATGDPANVGLYIPNVATADFLFQNGSSVTTGSPRIRIAGKTSGEGIISVAAVAGTPNPILLPTATGTSGQVLQTDGANPQQTSWVTDIKSYNHSGTAQTVTHMVRDRCTLGTDCSVTLSGSAVYTSSSTYDCVAIDRTGANAIQFAPSSGSAFALTGTGTDTISYVCVGN